jgi:acyl-CoA thioester hydrolase
MTFEYELTILEPHLDTFGHVNNAVYLTLFEQARWEAITQRGYGLAEVNRFKIGPTLLQVTIKWQREVRLRERVNIKTEVLSHQGKITVLRQTMVNAKGEDACVADFTIGLFDLTARRLIEPTPEWAHALGLNVS